MSRARRERKAWLRDGPRVAAELLFSMETAREKSLTCKDPIARWIADTAYWDIRAIFELTFGPVPA